MELFELPFMQRAFFVGLAIGVILPFLGVFVTLRKMSFFGDGLAHASLLGVAVGIVAGTNPFWTALVAGFLLGAGMYALERRTSLHIDAIIGVIFTTALALGVLLISLQSGYQPDLITFLFGNILTVSIADVWVIAGFSAVIFTALLFFLRQLTLISLDRDNAWLSGVRTGVLDLSFYLMLSVAIVLGVKLLGVILVSALLIIPPVTAKLIARSFKGLVGLSIILCQTAIVGGLVVSYYYDLPSGAAIVLFGSSMLFATVGLKELHHLFFAK